MPKHKSGLKKEMFSTSVVIHVLESNTAGITLKALSILNKKATAQPKAASGFSIEA
jgi:hypothetical protein